MRTLQESALLVDVTISEWKARRRDHEITKEVETRHEVKQAGNYNKALITSEELAPIRHAARAYYDFHRNNTLPWNDKGTRLLPAENIMDYLTGTSELQMKFESAVDAFIANYDFILTNARVRLNGLFRPGQYPKVQDLKYKFQIKSSMMNVPATDFQLSLSDSQLEQLKQQAQLEIENRLAQAHAENWNRIKEQLHRMKTIFSTENSPIYASMYDNLSELIRVLPKLNITQDKAIDEICYELCGLVAPVEEVRKHKEIRKEKAKEVDAILNKFNSFFQ